MDVRVETIDECRKKLTIKIPAERVDREVNGAYDRLSRAAHVAGFRPGKAPRKVLELHYGSQVSEEVKERLVEETFADAIREKKVDPAIAPRIDIKSLSLALGAPFHYDVEVEVLPELKVSGYNGIRATRGRVEVKDEEVARYIQTLLDQHAEFLPVEDRALAMGDFALLDISGTVAGAPIEARQGVWLEMTAESYLPGFCAHLVGMKAQEEKSVALTLPAEGVAEDIRGRDASFKVTLREIKLKRLPVLNDEFCTTLGNYATLEELRAAVRKDLVAHHEAEEERRVVEQIHAYLLEHIKVPLPPHRVTADAATIAQRTAERLLAQGATREEILAKREELLDASRREAERMLRLACIYDEIVRKEGITVSPDEVEARVKGIAGRLQRDASQVRAALEREGRLASLEEELRREKATALLVKNAKVKEAK